MAGEWVSGGAVISLPPPGPQCLIFAPLTNRGLLFVTGWPSITPRQGASGYARYAQVRREQRATVLVLFNLCDISRYTLRAATARPLLGEAPDYLVGIRSRRANHRCSRLLYVLP